MAMNFTPTGAPQFPVPFYPAGGQPPLPYAPGPALGGFPTPPAPPISSGFPAPPIPGGFPAPGTNPYAFGCGSELDKTV
jgi:hypothetical protein